MTAAETLSWGDLAIGYGPVLLVFITVGAVLISNARHRSQPPVCTAADQQQLRQPTHQQPGRGPAISTPARIDLMASPIDFMSNAQWVAFALGVPVACGLTAWAHVTYGILDCQLGNLVHTATVRLLEAEGEVHPAIIPGLLAVGTAIWMFNNGLRVQQQQLGAGHTVRQLAAASTAAAAGRTKTAGETAGALLPQRQCLVLLRPARSTAPAACGSSPSGISNAGDDIHDHVASSPTGARGPTLPHDVDIDAHIAQLSSAGSLLAGGRVMGSSSCNIYSVLLFHTDDRALVEACMLSNPAISSGRFEFELLDLSATRAP